MTIEAVSAPSQQLVDTIQMTIDQGDGRWIAREVGKDLKGIVLSRAREMDTQIDRAVRLAVVLNACGRQGYMNVMYLRLQRIRAGSMYEVIKEASVAGLLKGICDVSATEIVFSADGPASFFGDDDYTITFTQMPLAMAMLDFLHNSLGFGGPDGVGTLVAGIRWESRSGAVNAVSLALRSMLKGWLDERMARSYPARQVYAIRCFLRDFANASVTFHAAPREVGSEEWISITIREEVVGTYEARNWHRRRWPEGYQSFRDSGGIEGACRGRWDRPYADLIDDEAILIFWEFVIRSTSVNAGQIGMLRFRSAACAMLDYKQALVLSGFEETAASRAVSLFAADGREVGILDARSSVDVQADPSRREDDDTDDEVWSGGEETLGADVGQRVLKAVDGDSEEWISPLIYFDEHEDGPVKWLSDPSFKLLGLIMGSDNAEYVLFGGRKPDGTYARTIVRYLYFGDVQEAFIQGHGFDLTGSEHADEYAGLQIRFERLRRTTHHLVYATAQALLHQKMHVPAIVTLLKIEPDLIEQTIGRRPPIMEPKRLLEIVVERLEAGTCAAATRMKAGWKATNREGFRKEDKGVNAFSEDLVAGSAHVAGLHREVEQLASCLGSISRSAYQEDARRFSAILAEMYCQDR